MYFQVVVYELLSESGHHYVTWSGDPGHSDSLQISGLFGIRLGLKDGEEVLIKPLKSTSIFPCQKAFVEPLSVDDWEILELHSRFVENNLLNQVRVIWCGMVFPVWVQNMCIYCKVCNIDPEGICSLLENNTELFMSPKSRFATNIQNETNNTTIVTKSKESLSEQSSSFDDIPTGESVEDDHHVNVMENKCLCPTNSENSNQKAVKSEVTQLEDIFDSEYENLHTETDETIVKASSWSSVGFMGGVFNALLSLQTWIFGNQAIQRKISENNALNGLRKEVTDENIEFVARLQPMWKNLQDLKLRSKNPNGILFYDQPTNVYVSLNTLVNLGIITDTNNYRRTFIGTLQNLTLFREKQEEHKAKMEKSKERGLYKQLSEIDQDLRVKVIIRVIVVDFDIPGSVNDFIVSDGHLMVHNLLQRFLEITPGSCVKIDAVHNDASPVRRVTLTPAEPLLDNVTEEKIIAAFKTWISCVSAPWCPLVLGSNCLVRFLLDKDVFGIFVVTFSCSGETVSMPYIYIYPQLVESLQVVVTSCDSSKKTTTQRKSVTSKLRKMSDLEPTKPKLTLNDIGEVKRYSEQVLDYINMCLCQRPLAKAVFEHNAGMKLGGLVICGNRGTGKTTFAKAVLYECTKWPNQAYTTEIECTRLRGKGVESVRKILLGVFEEARTRQPSVVLLDDLDIIAAAPSGPEQEMTGEAHYYRQMAELFKDTFKMMIYQGNLVTVIATCKSKNSIHSSLVSPRGHHLFQKTIHLEAPEKDARAGILKAIILSKVSVNQDNVDKLDLNHIAASTEGYVAGDLVNIVDRAIHSHRMDQCRHNIEVKAAEITLTQQNFDVALKGFTPISLRDVPLHSAGHTKWDDIGGLQEVKKTLVQIIQWPSKYPDLLAACPLRMRSGVLLYGAPGTGKTLLAGAVARECGLNFISIKGPELLSKYIGASEQAVRDTFQRAQSAKPCVLFFDEFDSFAPRRGHDSTGVTDRVVNQLLTQLDGVESLEGVYVLAATSRPDLIDPALLRPGRLDKSLYCPIPDEEEILQILQVMSRNVNMAADVDLESLSKQCTNFTGADIKALIYNAQLNAIHEDQSHLNLTDKLTPTSSKVKAEWTFVNGSNNTTPEDATDNNYLVPEADQVVIEKKYMPLITYIPDLKEGPVTLSPEEELKLLEMVPQPSNSHQELAAQPPVEVHQLHLVKALEQTNPSVSQGERQKYSAIYETFLSSRGGKFSDVTQNVGKRATLA